MRRNLFAVVWGTSKNTGDHPYPSTGGEPGCFAAQKIGCFVPFLRSKSHKFPSCGGVPEGRGGFKHIFRGCLWLFVFCGVTCLFAADNRPNIISIMSDDHGWGQVGYMNHPVLKTPNLDAMAANGLRFDRFYAGSPVCSPTRAAMLTGRNPDRLGVMSWGYPMRLQEKTLSQTLKDAGYVTAHFGKWHLCGLSGPGVPIFADDLRHPGRFGFDEWISVTNFFEMDPLMSRNGVFEEFKGDSSEVIVAEAIKFIEKHHAGGKPMFILIWYGSPHTPFRASEEDTLPFADLNEISKHHYGELVAMDRSIGTLRQRLRELGIADNTLIVYCSDNGGLPEISPDTVGGLRGFKSSLYEGGIRVPGIIEWPAVIKPRITSYPVGVVDMFPTIVDILGLPEDVMLQPIDGISLKPLFTEDIAERGSPLGFRYGRQRAWVGDRYKLVSANYPQVRLQLYDLIDDPKESRDLAAEKPELFAALQQQFVQWNASVDDSFAGKDYPEGVVTPSDPPRAFWFNTPQYQPYLEQWKDRWEYETVIRRVQNP